MLEILVKAVFWVLNFVANLVLAPIMGLLSIIVGQNVSDTISVGITSIFDILNIVSKYFVVVIDLLCIPRSLFAFVVTIIASILGYVVFARTYFFAISIYNHFKP